MVYLVTARLWFIPVFRTIGLHRPQRNPTHSSSWNLARTDRLRERKESSSDWLSIIESHKHKNWTLFVLKWKIVSWVTPLHCSVILISHLDDSWCLTYCDLSYLNTHLDLSNIDVPLHIPLLHPQQKVLLSFSVPSILQGSSVTPQWRHKYLINVEGPQQFPLRSD